MSRSGRKLFLLSSWIPSVRGLLSRVPVWVSDPDACDQMYESLSRINSSYYRDKYPRLRDTSFTEVTVEEYRMVLATDSLKELEDMKKGMWKRLRERFNPKTQQDGAKE
ncbi:hypothetical protein FKM82_016697 [Ascaphus truei]